jgi:hypothetical protein
MHPGDMVDILPISLMDFSLLLHLSSSSIAGSSALLLLRLGVILLILSGVISLSHIS